MIGVVLNIGQFDHGTYNVPVEWVGIAGGAIVGT